MKSHGNIGFEIGPLITASGTFGDKSGVYRYRMGMLRALIHRSRKKKFKIILFTFNRDLLHFPLNPDILKLTQESNVEFIHKLPNISGQSMLNIIAESFLMKNRFFKVTMKVLNRLFKAKYYLEILHKRKQFQKYLVFLKTALHGHDVKIIYHSETGFHPMDGFKNIITNYDLTAINMAPFHRKATVDLQKRKYLFTRNECDGVVSISQSSQNDIMAASDVFADKEHCVCYPGLDPIFEHASEEKTTTQDIADLKEYAQKFGIDIRKKKYLLYYGTFEPRKNALYLVRAFVDLQKEGRIPQDFKLILIGGKGWGKVHSTITHYIDEEFPIAHKRNILLINFVGDDFLIKFLKNAYALVYPSLYEGFGLPILEGMSVGTPVITSRNSSMSEVGGDAVLYINPWDIDDLKANIEKIIAEPKLAKKLSKDGQKQSDMFNWLESVIELEKMLLKL